MYRCYQVFVALLECKLYLYDFIMRILVLIHCIAGRSRYSELQRAVAEKPIFGVRSQRGTSILFQADLTLELRSTVVTVVNIVNIALTTSIYIDLGFLQGGGLAP